MRRSSSDARSDGALARRPLPEHVAAVEVETERPAVDARLHACGDADAGVRHVQARFRTLVVIVGDYRREKDLAVPDDRTRPAKARNPRSRWRSTSPRGSSATTDVPPGPRNCGQLSDSAAAAACSQSSTARAVASRAPIPSVSSQSPLGSKVVAGGNRQVHHAAAGVSTGRPRGRYPASTGFPVKHQARSRPATPEKTNGRLLRRRPSATLRGFHPHSFPTEVSKETVSVVFGSRGWRRERKVSQATISNSGAFNASPSGHIRNAQRFSRLGAFFPSRS